MGCEVWNSPEEVNTLREFKPEIMRIKQGKPGILQWKSSVNGERQFYFSLFSIVFFTYTQNVLT